MTLLPRLLSDVESDRSNDKLARDGLGLARSILAPVSAAWWIRASYCISINHSSITNEIHVYLFQSLLQPITLEMYTINSLLSSLDECRSQIPRCTMMINVSSSWSKTCSTHTTPYAVYGIVPSHSIELHLILCMWIAKEFATPETLISMPCPCCYTNDRIHTVDNVACWVYQANVHNPISCICRLGPLVASGLLWHTGLFAVVRHRKQSKQGCRCRDSSCWSCSWVRDRRVVSKIVRHYFHPLLVKTTRKKVVSGESTSSELSVVLCGTMTVMLPWNLLRCGLCLDAINEVGSYALAGLPWKDTCVCVVHFTVLRVWREGQGKSQMGHAISSTGT